MRGSMPLSESPCSQNSQTTVLIVDDDASIIMLLEEFLSMEGYKSITAGSAEEALKLVGNHKIEIAILDLKLPQMSGIDLLKILRESQPHIDAVMLTGFSTVETAIEALRLGAYDYLTKPFNIEELSLLLQKICETRRIKQENVRLFNELQEANKKLAARVEAADIELKKSYQQLQNMSLSAIKSFALALDMKDKYTTGHSERVSLYSRIIGEQMRLGEHELEILTRAGLLHDIGKIFVPIAVINKAGRLTDEEYTEMKKHPEYGYNLLKPFDFLEEALPLIRHHHERVDGRGYPDRLPGEELSVLEQIIAVADAFDAMTSNRSYRQALSLEEAVGELEKCAGQQFGEPIVNCFVGYLQENPNFLVNTHGRKQ